MSDLINPQKTIEVIKKHEFVFQKKFGQNFLIDKHVLDKIIAGASITKDDVVLEVGPGIGTITQRLAECAAKVIAVEIDRDLIPILDETLADYDNVDIINSDVLKLDLKELCDKYAPGKKIKLVANLPYYITTPIIMKIFESNIPCDVISVMVQKEVADRMQAKPGTKDYGSLSVAVQYYSTAYVTAYVPQNCFIPRPNVGSAVITLTKYDEIPYHTENEKLMFDIVKAAFNQRRKTLQNAINNNPELNYTKEEVLAALNKLGLPENVRGEALSVKEFSNFSNALMNQ